MLINEEKIQSRGTRWVEGLILLILLTVLIIFTASKNIDATLIQEEPVSAWSGTVDNLK